jgi:hypothetical protein
MVNGFNSGSLIFLTYFTTTSSIGAALSLGELTGEMADGAILTLSMLCFAYYSELQKISEVQVR